MSLPFSDNNGALSAGPTILIGLFLVFTDSLEVLASLQVILSVKKLNFLVVERLYLLLL